MRTLKEIQNIDRPREKLFKTGAASLKDYELVAILLGSGIRGKDVLKLSKEIIRILKQDFINIDIEKLMQIHGLGQAKVAQIVAAIELCKRYLIKPKRKILIARDVYEELREYHNKKQEYFLALYLSGAKTLCHKSIITIGILDKSIVHPREVFAPAIEKRCAGVIVAHNHPSGSLTPSQADIAITKRLQESGNILGIELIDHIIMTKDNFVSLKDLGLL
ncbi:MULTISPECIES: DNA repair protein RadC [unclassified Nitratiruptor]|uniref:RadC family protein n=1 Tax=unclassified Nitratiruptor TaxID=2624044 RepID=UPI001938A932|nr:MULTISPECIES: DNA repair protein RadC [unclassified Nitratiruptor]BCD59490.1 DNA repair protein RadC [Nitratiruptor sp. YY08-10]BCD63414.1 DNA repair protein RadC [Nitratiruptor sp. YY08-14]